jgi:hypothetical protein
MLSDDFSESTYTGAKMEVSNYSTPRRTYRPSPCITVQQLLDVNSCGKPAEAEAGALGSNLDDAPFNEAWNYRSAVRMLMYHLGSKSFPEIAFAVHQCARFAHNPKQSHGKAVKRIGRYLPLGTKGNGLIIKPGQDLKLDVSADADFASLWNAEDVHDPICVRSRYCGLLGKSNIDTQPCAPCNHWLPPPIYGKLKSSQEREGIE